MNRKIFTHGDTHSTLIDKILTSYVAFDYGLFLQFLKKMLLLQYLVTVLEGDFLPRNCAYQGKISLFPQDVFNESVLQISYPCRKYELEHFEGVIG